MAKAFKLPLLPGCTVGQELLRTNYRKTQALSGSGEQSLTTKPMPVDFDSTMVSQSASLSGTQASGTGGNSPSKSEPARQVLRFFGYYNESVNESAIERERCRKVTVCYFVEDDTISVSEPKQDNAGIAFQGCVVKRHRVPSPDGNGFVTFERLSVGRSVTFYGRTYHLIDCAAFTRSFMASIGVPMAPGQDVPVDSYAHSRKPHEKPAGIGSVAASVNAAGMKVKLSPAEVRGTKQFLANDRKVLRFDAIWDDEKALYGEVHNFTIYYFLSDDGIEVVERSDPAGGRDPFPSFVRRQKVPKPRANATSTKFENTMSNLAFTGKDNAAFYTDADLRIGATIAIFGRHMLIHDCDPFTRDHLREKFGVTDFTPIDVSRPAPPAPKREPPPYNGYGDEEDSLGSWKSLDIKPPRRDTTDANKFGDGVVKFALKLDSQAPSDTIRSFVLTCYLANKTISIFEPVARNAGFQGGKFLQRQKVTNTITGQPFVASDFYVGAKVTVNGFNFIVHATDDRSLTLMESHSSDFARSNINAIVHKLQAMLQSATSGLHQAFITADTDRSGSLCARELTALFAALSLPVCEQEVITLIRYFDRNGDGCVSFSELETRLLDPDSGIVGPAADPRDWQSIHAASIHAEHDALSVKDKVALQSERVLTTTAAYAARAFLEAYQARRHLFHTEFKFAADYATDGLIGEPEFRVTITDKLRLPITEQQLTALCSKAFPPRVRRVTYEEFHRLLTNTSVHDHNFEQIKNRR